MDKPFEVGAIAAAVSTGRTDAVSVARAALARIEASAAIQPAVWITRIADADVLAYARRVDARIAGPAADLYLVLWGRLALDPAEPGRTRRERVEVSGDRALAALVRTG